MDEIEKAYREYGQDVYRYLFSLTLSADLAEELTQETFFRAMSTIDGYRGDCKVLTWLCQIAKHLWYQWMAKHARMKQAELTEQITDHRSVEEAFFLHMEKLDLYKAIHSLPEIMRELVYLRVTGEFTFAEIAKILGKSESWARTTFYRAKQKIIEEMEEMK